MPNAPAKRAAHLLIAIGVVLLVASFLSTMYALLRPEWIDAQLAPHRELLADSPLLQPRLRIWIIAGSGALGLIESGLSIALGLYILRGRRWAIVTSLVLTALRLLTVGLFALLAILGAVLGRAMRADAADLQRYDSAPTAPPPPAMSPLSIGVGVASTIILVLLLVWLVQALRAHRPASGPLSPVPGGEG